MNPGKINWGSSGTGGPQHLAGEHFMKLANIKMVHIPDRGNAPMIQALRANEVQVIFDTQTLVLPYIEEGRMTALAISATKRSTKLPNVPTIRETGLVDFSIEITNFALAPKGLPAPIQAELNKQIATALENKEVRDRLRRSGTPSPRRARTLRPASSVTSTTLRPPTERSSPSSASNRTESRRGTRVSFQPSAAARGRHRGFAARTHDPAHE